MARAILSGRLFRPLPGSRSCSRRQNAGIPSVGIKLLRAAGAATCVGHRKSRRPPVVRSILPEQSSPQVEEPLTAAGREEEVDVKAMVQFLYEDLPHLFDDQGIARTMYDDRVQFRDPITWYDTIDGYLFNIGLLRSLFRPDFQFHHVKQLRYYKTPDLETPQYQILKRAKDYEVRKYAPFLVVEAKSDKLSGSAGFNNVTGYIFGKNSSSEKIPMTTPVFTVAIDDELSNVSIQIVLPLNKELDKLPDPDVKSVTL